MISHKITKNVEYFTCYEIKPIYTTNISIRFTNLDTVYVFILYKLLLFFNFSFVYSHFYGANISNHLAFLVEEA